MIGTVYQNETRFKELQDTAGFIILREADHMETDPPTTRICGRAAFTYDEWINEKGDKEIIKTGTKMRVESDFGYEPSFLFEMERIQPETDPKKKRGSRWVHRATVLKDRADLMNGKKIDDPCFKDFLPIIKALNLGGEHFVLDTERTSDDMIQNPDYSYEDRRKFQTIFTEEIEGELISALPGQSTGEKKLKTDILEVVFMTRSWARIKEFSPDLLKKGLGSVKQLCSLLKTNGEYRTAKMLSVGSAVRSYGRMTMFPISWDMRKANSSWF